MNNQNKFLEYRKKYPDFIYEKYEILEEPEYLHIKYYFKIPKLTTFTPEIKILKRDIKIEYHPDYLNYLVFQIGLIELISYCKCTCSKKIHIQAGYINEQQIDFLKKLYFNGLGEFLYTNGIAVKKEELFDIICEKEETHLPKMDTTFSGNLICVGGGKDSCVSLELLKNEKENTCFMINPKKPSLACCEKAGYHEENIMKVERILDKKIVELNQEGFLNGHTPFSSLVAFLSYLCAYLQGKKYIILSNENSANEPTVLGTNINHQYSKTYEFEQDFNQHMHEFLNLEIEYFSILRGLSEYNIAKLFSKYPKYHSVFKSCNLGSKNKEWNWCCNCPKCLFIYIILSAHLTKEELISIFQEELYQRKDLLETFLEIIGYSKTKPFECVGTYEEARLAVSQAITTYKGELPYLLKYYKDHFPLELDSKEIEEYKEEHNIPSYYNDLVKKELNQYVS